MAQRTATKRVVVSPDPHVLAASVAERICDRLAKRTRAGKTAHLAVTGGGIGTAVLAAVGATRARRDVDWTRVHVWFSDERFVPAADPARNVATARAALLDALPLPAGNVHPMAASDSGMSLAEAAAAYGAELARFGPTPSPATGVIGGDWPSFDVCLLGVGADAHIASLFPDRPQIRVVDRAAVGLDDAPKPPAQRITLTRPVINSAKRVWLVVAGVDKAAALGLALAGASYDSVPAAGAKGRRRTVFFVDEAAAGNVPADLIDGDY